MNTRVIFKAFSNSLLARTLKSGMLAKIMSRTFPNFLTFKIYVCTNLPALPNLPALSTYQHVSGLHILIPSIRTYLSGLPAFHLVSLTHQYTYLPGAMVTKPTGLSSNLCGLPYLTVYHLPILVTVHYYLPIWVTWSFVSH